MPFRRDGRRPPGLQPTPVVRPSGVRLHSLFRGFPKWILFYLRGSWHSSVQEMTSSCDLKRCVQACGCKIMTPRYACKMPSSCVSKASKKNKEKKESQAKPARKPGKASQEPSQTSQKASQEQNQTSQKASQQPQSQKPNQTNQKPSQTSQKASQKPSQTSQSQPKGKPARSQPKISFQGLALLGILPNRISSGSLFCSHTPAHSVLDFESFAGQGHFLDGQVPGASQVE